MDVKRLSKNTITTRELLEQGPLESRNLWLKVTEALKKKNDEMAIAEKSRIEQKQRKLLAMSQNHSEIPNFFIPIDETKSMWKFKRWNSADISHELYDTLESLYHAIDLNTEILEQHFSDDVD